MNETKNFVNARHKHWLEVIDEKVEVTESDTVDYDIFSRKHFENPMLKLNRKINEYIEIDFDKVTKKSYHTVLSTQQPSKTLTLMKMWTRQTTLAGIKQLMPRTIYKVFLRQQSIQRCGNFETAYYTKIDF